MTDWYCDFDQLKKFLPPIQKDHRILLLGGGISELGAKICTAFKPKELIEIDFSQTAIDYQTGVHDGNVPGIKFMKMDFRSLDFPPESFDLVVDKAAIDSIMSTVENDELISPNPGGNTMQSDMKKIEDEIWRVLKPNGLLFMASVLKLDDVESNVMSHRPWIIRPVSVISDLIHFYWIIKPNTKIVKKSATTATTSSTPSPSSSSSQ